MPKYRVLALFSLSSFCAASAALSQEPPAFDADACAKRCREMAAARSKSRDCCAGATMDGFASADNASVIDPSDERTGV